MHGEVLERVWNPAGTHRHLIFPGVGANPGRLGNPAHLQSASFSQDPKGLPDPRITVFRSPGLSVEKGRKETSGEDRAFLSFPPHNY